MARHRLDTSRTGPTDTRVKQFLRLEGFVRGAWPRSATALWLRRQRDPRGRTVEAFTGIDRGRVV